MAVVQKNNVREYKIDLDSSAGNAFYLFRNGTTTLP